MSGTDRKAVDAASSLRLALAGLREGTEILRTGGGTTLTAEQCNVLLDEIDRLTDDLRVARANYDRVAGSEAARWA